MKEILSKDFDICTYLILQIEIPEIIQLNHVYACIYHFVQRTYWKCNFPMTLHDRLLVILLNHVRLLVGRSVCLS